MFLVLKYFSSVTLNSLLFFCPQTASGILELLFYPFHVVSPQNMVMSRASDCSVKKISAELVSFL